VQPSGLAIDLIELFSAVDRAIALATATVVIDLSLAIYPRPSVGRQRIVRIVTIVTLLILQWLNGDDPMVRIVTRIVTIRIITIVIGDGLPASGDGRVTILCLIQPIGAAGQ
jgi:hypothetical protein